MIFQIDWNFVGGAAFLAATIIAVATALFRLSPVGAMTVQTLKELRAADAAKLQALEQSLHEQSETIADLQDHGHRLELQLKDRETRIAVLEAAPDTQAIFDEIHLSNDAVATLAATQARLVGLTEDIAASLEANTRVLGQIEQRLSSDHPTEGDSS